MTQCYKYSMELSSYQRRLEQTQLILMEHQAKDGGWGLTFDSASSLVNTTEALYVLTANHTEHTEATHRAVQYLKEHMREHARPRAEGGRGANTRFVSFALLGMSLIPSHLDTAILLELSWALDWLEQAKTRDGWPERRGDVDTSLHQTAYAVSALSSLAISIANLPHFARQTEDLPSLVRIQKLIEHGVEGLLKHCRASHLWPVQTYAETAPSPSKSALAILALADARSTKLFDPIRKWLVGGSYNKKSQRTLPLDTVISEGSWALTQLSPRWHKLIEHDPEVPGTDWVHLAYAMAPYACIIGGASINDTAISSALDTVQKTWSDKHGTWVEPSGRPTIRSAFHTTRCLQSALNQSLGLTRVEHIQIDSALTAIEFTEYGILLKIPPNTFPIRISPTLRRLLNLFISRSTATTEEISEELGISRNSVAKYIGRLNSLITKESSAYAPTFITRSDTGYQLSPTILQLMDDSTGHI